MQKEGSVRSKLKPYFRQRGDSAGYWVARGSVPVRQPGGKIARKRIEPIAA